MLLGQGEKFGAARREQAFVGSDDRLPKLQGTLDVFGGRCGPTDELDNHLRLRIIDCGFCVARERSAWQKSGGRAIFFRIANDDVAHIKRQTRARAKHLALLAQDLDDAATDHAVAEEGNSNGSIRGHRMPDGLNASLVPDALLTHRPRGRRKGTSGQSFYRTAWRDTGDTPPSCDAGGEGNRGEQLSLALEKAIGFD